jgi:hypothetical protein
MDQAAQRCLRTGSLRSLALTVSGLGVHVGNLAHITVSGQLALATLKSATPLVEAAATPAQDGQRGGGG